MRNQTVPDIGILLKTTYADSCEGLRDWRLWSKFAWHDMQARHRRSWVGPFWLALTAIVFISALSIIYSILFQIDLTTYVPVVAIGVVVWVFVAAVATEGVNTFVEAETYIRQLRVSPFIFVFRVVWRNMIVFGYQFVITLVVLVVFRKIEPSMMPLAAFGMLLLFLQAVWVTSLLGILGARFRDLQPMIANLLQVLFFVTPVVWLPAMLGQHRWIADYNPLNSLIAVVRGPLLGEMPTAANYGFVLVTTAIGFLAAALMHGRFRNRIVYWL